MDGSGFAKGLAVKHDFGSSIERLYQRENLIQQVRVERERKAQLYGQMMQHGHVKGDYNNKRLEEFYKDLNGQVVNFVTNNPNWETDPGLFSQFTNLTSQYIDNDIIREDKQVEQNFNALQQAASRGDLEPEEVFEEMDKYHNYISNGADPYVFIQPSRLTTTDLLIDASKNIGYVHQEIERPGPEGVRQRFAVSVPNKESIRLQVNANFDDPRAKKVIEREYNELEDKSSWTSAKDYWAHKLKASAEQSERMVGVNQLDFYKYKHQYDQSQTTGSNYKNYILENINNALERYKSTGKMEDAYWKSSPMVDMVAFTPQGKIGGVSAVTPDMEWKFAEKVDTDPATKESTKSDSYEPLNLRLNYVELIGSGPYEFKDLRGYVVAPVEVQLSNTAASDTTLVNELLRHGFEEQEKGTMSISGGRWTFDQSTKVYRGTLRIKSNENAIAMQAFDAQSLSAEERKNLRGIGAYDVFEQEQDSTNPLKRINAIAPGYNWKANNKGEIVSENNMFVLDPQTGDIIAR